MAQVLVQTTYFSFASKAGDVTHWNVSGNWKTDKGGDQTETSKLKKKKASIGVL